MIIGGGAVAERKVESLLEAGAVITVISPTLSTRLTALVSEGLIRHTGRRYREGDLTGHHLAFVATDDADVSEVVAREGRARGVWVNAADDPERCDFILPSVLRRGPLVVAVATGGSSPALARAIREELEAYFTEDYAALAELAAEVRRELRHHRPAVEGDAWRAVLDPDVRRLVAEGQCEEAKARLLQKLRTCARA